MKRWTYVAATLGAALLAACGGGGSGYSTGPNGTPTGTGTGGNANTNQVTMQDQSFAPGTINVAKGATVTWTWPTCDNSGYGGYGSGCISHSVIFDDNVQSPVQTSGTFTRTFTSAGTFDYHCGVHGAPMSGKVVVQ